MVNSALNYRIAIFFNGVERETQMKTYNTVEVPLTIMYDTFFSSNFPHISCI